MIVDRATGRHLDFQVGQQHEVTPDWDKIPEGVTVTVLHTHPVNVSFGPEDWDVLANRPAVREIEAVCPDEVHCLEKPVNWEFQTACRPGLSIFGSVFERLLASVRADPKFAANRFPSELAARVAQIEETNSRLLESHFGTGFRFRKE